jgi:pyruvate/2-oxoglutarate/acetoin dehydrogenase E1 component
MAGAGLARRSDEGGGVSNDRTYREAILEALVEEMESDARVVLLGEDVSHGGVFNVTPGLIDRFGPERVIDMPISEMAFTGAAFGAAATGSLRPVVEIMFGDFLGLTLDTLVNQASKFWFLSNGQASVPLVVRTAVGAGGRLGACHSQTPTGWFLGEPGLKLVAPATPADAKALTRDAIRDDNPTLVFEHKLLYGKRGELDDAASRLGIGRATIRRPGADVTLCGALAAVDTCLAAAVVLEAAGVDAEVVDLRSLRPLDVTTIAQSAASTRRLVVVEEGPPLGGYAAEVVAAAVEHAGPIAARRVTMPDIPIPFSPPLESWVLPSVEAVTQAAMALIAGRARVASGSV